MKVGDTNLIYFAYPKCASETIRSELKLQYTNRYIYNDWDASDIDYCHVRPSRYIKANCTPHGINTYFTIVRNTYERLVSAWKYLQHHGVVIKYSPHRRLVPLASRKLFYQFNTFESFIQHIYNNKDALHTIPMYWMILPFDQYFQDVYDNPHVNLKVFDTANLDALAIYLKSNYNLTFNPSKRINTTSHDHYSTYYTPQLVDMVTTVYNYEITRFKFTIEPTTTPLTFL